MVVELPAGAARTRLKYTTRVNPSLPSRPGIGADVERLDEFIFLTGATAGPIFVPGGMLAETSLGQPSLSESPSYRQQGMEAAAIDGPERAMKSRCNFDDPEDFSYGEDE